MFIVIYSDPVQHLTYHKIFSLAFNPLLVQFDQFFITLELKSAVSREVTDSNISAFLNIGFILLNLEQVSNRTNLLWQKVVNWVFMFIVSGELLDFADSISVGPTSFSSQTASFSQALQHIDKHLEIPRLRLPVLNLSGSRAEILNNPIDQWISLTNPLSFDQLCSLCLSKFSVKNQRLY